MLTLIIAGLSSRNMKFSNRWYETIEMEHDCIIIDVMTIILSYYKSFLCFLFARRHLLNIDGFIEDQFLWGRVMCHLAACGLLLFLSVYVCLCVCMYIYPHTHIHRHTHTHTHTHTHIYIYISVYLSVCLHVIFKNSKHANVR